MVSGVRLMSLVTKFKVTEALLYDRQAVHELVDIFWKCGIMTRDEVYLEIAAILNTDIVPHISDLGHEDIYKVASAFFDKLALLDYAPCASCQHSDGFTSIGIPYCSALGGAFCSMCKDEEAVIQRCQYYKEMTPS